MPQHSKLKSELPLQSDTTEPDEESGMRGPERTAKAQLDFLKSTVENWVQEVEAQPSEVKGSLGTESQLGAPWTIGKIKLQKLTVLKSAVAILAAVILGWIPLQRLFATTSAEAVVNARVVTIRAPIDGDISTRISDAEVGREIPAGFELLTIKNSRANQTDLNHLKQTREQLVTNISALRTKRQLLENHLHDLTANKDRYRVARVEQLERQISGVEASIAAANAKRDVTAKALTRARTLFVSGDVAEALVDKADGDDRVAVAAINELVERLKAIKVELAAAQKGTFVSDGYNDSPESAQRGLEVELQLAEVNEHLAGAKRELESVDRDLSKEVVRSEKSSTAEVRASFAGRVWEVMTAPNQHVSAGQELMRLLDCSSATVTASVSESVYQKLQIGQPARFKPTSGGQEMQGTIVGLSGLAGGPTNNAIHFGALSREPYHITVKIPGLTHEANCQISRSGLVTFDTKSRG